jgi:Co/Zn/Cd efflux system component
MSDCCADTQCEIDKLRLRQRNVLVAVLAINAVLFLVESAAGLIASSTALVADSLDMLGDALVYGFSLYVVTRNDLWKARAASVKGWIMLGFGASVLAQALYKVVFPELPSFQIIEVIGLLALAANSVCLGLLWRHRADDVNMRSVWLCSRNDIIANVSVLFAGVCVWALSSQWPDVVVGIGIAALFLKSAVAVLRDAASVKAAYQEHSLSFG